MEGACVEGARAEEACLEKSAHMRRRGGEFHKMVIGLLEFVEERLVTSVW